nr:hypothetical protein [Paraflavitalea speifideiaquila]
MPAAQPQTLLTTTRVVPDWFIALSTSPAVSSSFTPILVNSSLKGFTNNGE